VAKLRSDVVRENLSNQKKGEFIGFSLRTTDSPYTFFDRLEAYGDISVEDVKRVAQEVLRPSNRTTVPVVTRQRFAALTAQFVAGAEVLPAQAASALTEAVAIALERQKHAQTQATLDVEADAIARLAQRAETAKQGADGETRAKIDAYITDNEKGVTKRTARVEQGRTKLAEDRKVLGKRSKKHARNLRKLRRMRWNPSQPPAALVISLVEGLAGVGPRRVETIDTSEMTDEALLPLVAGYEALMSWTLEDAGQHATAAAHRARAIAVAGPALASAGDDAKGTLLRAAHALAWETQITGKTLVDAPTQGKRRRGSRRRR
jgi:hypothetical protein